MARKNELKNDTNRISFNTRTKTVMADVAQVNIKEKVSSVREVVSGRSNNEIVLVLQYYDNDVEKAIQAYLEDGAKEALTDWHFSDPKALKKKRNKKKNQSSPAQSNAQATPSSDSKTSPLVNGDAKEHLLNGNAVMNGTDVSKGNLPNGHVSPVQDKPSNNSYTTTSNSQGKTETTSPPDPSNTVSVTSPVLEGSEVKVKDQRNKEKSQSPLPQRQHHDAKSRTHSGSHASDHRNRTSSTSSVSDGKPVKKVSPHHVLERSSKDLHRQTVSLERLRLVFNDEVDKSYKRIKSVFDEIRNCLHRREEELIGEMNFVRDIGRDTFNMRQGLAADLKVKIDRADRLSETELSELRHDIKNFVSDRKIDEDLGRTTRFMYGDDKLKEDIAQLGEVVPVKCIYIQRHPSHSSIESGAPLETEPLPVQKPAESARNSGREEKKPGDLSHLDSTQIHEVAELQRRLKNSLTLEGIPVETFPERPVSMPIPEKSSSTSSSNTNRPNTANSRNNRNQRGRGRGGGGGQSTNQDRRNNADNGGPNRGYILGENGERTVFIGKGTRPQSGANRPPRGGSGGRGGGGYRGRGGRGRGNARSPQDDSRGTGGKGAQRNVGTENAGAGKDTTPSPGLNANAAKHQNPNRDTKPSPRRNENNNENRNRRDTSGSPRKPQNTDTRNRRGGGDRGGGDRNNTRTPAGQESKKGESTTAVAVSVGSE